jgi:hypothetical protein
VAANAYSRVSIGAGLGTTTPFDQSSYDTPITGDGHFNL